MWEKFEDPQASKSKKLKSAAKSSESGAVCAADAMTSEWTALGDGCGYVHGGRGTVVGRGGGGVLKEK